jgi:diguanylate cyclase (GGDEF)-like protein
MPPNRPSLRLVNASRPASVDALIEQARNAERDGRRDVARQLYDRVLYRLEEKPDAGLQWRLFLWIGRTYLADANYGAALDCVEASIAAAAAANDAVGRGESIHLKAAVLFEQGDLAGADQALRDVRTIARDAGDARLAALAARDLGACASARRDLYSAMQHYETCLTELRALGSPADLADALGSYGDLSADLQHWEAAERSFTEALQITAALGDLASVARAELRLAEMWVERKELEQARRATDRAREAAKSIREPGLNGTAMKVAGIIAREMGEYTKAEEHFGGAERIAQAHDDLLLAADTARERADLYARQEKHRETLQSLNRGYRFLSQLRTRRDVGDIARRIGRLERDFLRVVERWAQQIEAKDAFTRGHCERMVGIAVAIAARMDFDRRSLFWFRIGALLHDVGKIIIPPDLLNKPGRLTAEEWAIIRRHPTAGAELLAGIDFPWDVRPIVEFHHECWDGSGYPHGLAGEQIPLSARIVCAADVFDALTSDRSFKKALTPAEAIEVMRRDVGRMFDPAVFRVLEELVRTREELPSGRLARDTNPRGMRAYSPSQSTGAVRTKTPPLADELTGTLPRGPLLEALTKALESRRGTAQPVSVLLIDIDELRRVNDAYGHRQGDDVLWSVAKLLMRTLREGDIVGRYAGDEFLVVLPDTRTDTARDVAERVRAAIAQLRCTVSGAQDDVVAVTVTVGVATSPLNGDSPNTLVASADRARFSARKRGGNGVGTAELSAPGTAREALPLDRFVGRLDDLRRMISILERTTRGEPQVVALVGEAGVGKSALLQEVAPEVRLRSGIVVTGQSPQQVTMPYQPWAEIVAALTEKELVPHREWPELSRLVPAVAGLGVPADVAAHAAARPGANQGSKYALVDEVVEVLRAAAAAHPLALVFENFHWADTATWELLEFVLASIDRDRILICLTIRAEEAKTIADRRRQLAADPRVHQITIQPLSLEELKRWVEDVFHQGALANDFPTFLHDYTEGNPLRVIQALRALHEDGGIWYAGTRWEWRPVPELHLPAAFSDLLGRRLDRLSPKARGILAAASVIGPTVDPDLVIATGIGSADAVRGAIDEGLAAGVLEASRSNDARLYAFSHNLLAEAVRRGLSGKELQKLHERAARALELRAPTGVAEIAAHYHAAGDDARAYRYALLASERAASVYAHDEASEFLQVALRHAPAARELAEARVRLARVAESAGRYELAAEMCDLALDWYTSQGSDQEAIGILRLRERLRLLRGEPPGRSLEACRHLLAKAEELDLPGERTALLIVLAELHARLLDWSSAERNARAAVDIAATLDDRRLRADAMIGLGTVLLELKPREALEYFGSALAVYTSEQDRHAQTRCWISTGTAHARAGNPAQAADAYAVACDLGRSAHAPDLAGLAALHLGAVHRREGAYDASAERFEEAIRLFTAVRNEPHRLAAMSEVAHLARERAEPSKTLSLYDAVISLATRIGQLAVQIGALGGAGLAQLALGDREGAEQRLRDADLLIAGRANWWCQGRELVSALGVRLALASGHAGLATETFTTALALAERYDRYAAAWLVAECAAFLGEVGVSVGEIVARFARDVEAQRFTPIGVRLNAYLSRYPATDREAKTA